MKTLFTLTFGIFLNCAFAQASMTTINRNGYIIQYPTTWKIDTSNPMGTDLLIIAPYDNTDDVFTENVNVLIQDLKGQNIGLSEYKQISEKQVAEVVTDGKIYESSIMQKANSKYYRLVCSYKAPQGDLTLKVISVCYIKDEKAYLATFVAQYSNYDKYQKTAESILNSFSAQ